jgi:ferredoxin
LPERDAVPIPVEQLFRVILETPDGTFSITCRATQYVWDAAGAAGIRLPAICHQGYCLTCAARLLQGEVDQSDSRQYFPEDRDAGFVLPCTARPLSDLRLRTHQQWEMRQYRQDHGLPAPYA